MGKRDGRGGGRGRRTVVQLNSSKESYLARYGYTIHEGNRLSNLMGGYKDSEEDDSEEDRHYSPTPPEQVAVSESLPDPVPDSKSSIVPPKKEVEIDSKVANFLAEIDAMDVPPVESGLEEPQNNDQTKEEEEAEARPCLGVGDNQKWTIRLGDAPQPAAPVVKSDMSAYHQKWVRGKTEGSQFKQNWVKGETEFVKKEKPKEIPKIEKEEIIEEPSSLWQQCVDENTQYQYYWNTITNEVTWEIPAEFTQYLLLKNKFEEKVAKAKVDGIKFKIVSKKSSTDSNHKQPEITNTSEKTTVAAAELPTSTGEDMEVDKQPIESGTVKSLEPSSGIKGAAKKDIKDRMRQLLKIEGSDSEDEDQEEETQDLPDSTNECTKKKKTKAAPEKEGNSVPKVSGGGDSDVDIDDIDIDKELEMALERKKDGQKAGKKSSTEKKEKEAKRIPKPTLVEEMRKYVEEKKKEEAKKKAAIEEQLAKELDKTAAATRRKEEKRKREMSHRPSDEFEDKRARYTVDPRQEWELDRLADRDHLLERDRLVERDRVIDRDRIVERDRLADPYTDWEYRRTRDRYDSYGDYDVSSIDHLDAFEERFRRERPPPPPPDSWRNRAAGLDSRHTEGWNDRRLEDKLPRETKESAADHGRDKIKERRSSDKSSKKSKSEKKKSDSKPSTSSNSTSLVAYGDDDGSSSDNEAETPKLSEKEIAKRNKEIEKKELEKELAVLKERAEDLSELCMSKLEFLEVTSKSLSKLQILLIELQTRFKDWQAGGLETKYYLSRLKESDSQIQQYEESAAPSGWSCHWDRAFRRYFYLNKKNGESQWDYPEPESEAEADTTKEEVVDTNSGVSKKGASIDGTDPEDVGSSTVTSTDPDDSTMQPDTVSSSAPTAPQQLVAVNIPSSAETNIETAPEKDSSKDIVWPVHPEEPPPPGTETFLHIPPPPSPPPPQSLGKLQMEYDDNDSSNDDADMDLDQKYEEPGESFEITTSVPSPRPELYSAETKLYDIQNEAAASLTSESIISQPLRYSHGNEVENTNVISRPPQPAVSSSNHTQIMAESSGVSSSMSVTQSLDGGAYQDGEKEKKKKKKDKKISGTSLSLKKKNVSSLVMKWQKVKKEVAEEERHREEREMAIRQKLEEWKQEQS